MNTEINEVEINGVKYVRKDSVQSLPELNKQNAVIVRAETAGVFFGYFTKTDLGNGGVVELKQARRLWYWSGASSLSQLAVEGTKCPGECKFPIAMPNQEVTGVLEIIAVTDAAKASIDAVKLWEQ